MEIVLEALEERVDCGLGVAEGGGQMEDGGWEKGERSWGQGGFFVCFEIGLKGSPGPTPAAGYPGIAALLVYAGDRGRENARR